MLNGVFRSVLTNTTDKTPKQICNDFQTKLTLQIKKYVNDKNVDALSIFVNIRKQNKSITKLGALTLLGYLRRQHTDLIHFNTIPFNCHTSKSFCHIPIEKITTDNIKQVRVNDLIADLCHPLQTFFKIEIPKSEQPLGDEQDEDLIEYAKEAKNYYTRSNTATIQELTSTIAEKGKFMAFHEIIKKPLNKCYFDIESTTDQYSAYHVINTIKEVL